MKVGIVGHGVVGSSVHALFPEAEVYDPFLGLEGDIDSCDIAFVCVPTPEKDDGSCDTSIVEQAFRTHTPGLWVVRSTMPQAKGRYVYQPEFLGVTPGHPYRSDRDVPYVILGGKPDDTARVVALYRTVLPPETAYHQTTRAIAHLVKYATNAFLAVKVEFANELADLLGDRYEEFRHLWLLDPRIGRSHTGVDPANRGFGGACLPKDISALVESSRIDLPVIRAARDANKNRSARL